MTQNISISDSLYKRLEVAARKRGLSSVEQFLEQWSPDDDDLRQRQETVRRIEALRERLFAAYGEMQDSVSLIEEDRAR